MDIAILLYDELTALDAIGPYEVLKLIPNSRVRFVGKTSGPKKMNGSALTLIADETLFDVQEPDILLIPGGPGATAIMKDAEILGWIRDAHETSRWTTSVCTGSLILGVSGILMGKKATSHWMAMNSLKQFGSEPVNDRVVRDGKIVTSAGVSAGIDMALTLVGLECGEQTAKTIQLGIEYDPRPPFDCGSPEKASPSIVELLRSRANK